MFKDPDWVVLGKLGRPHGLKGLIRVISFTEPEVSILEYKPWFIHYKHEWTPLELETFQIQNQLILIKIVDCAEREELAKMTNCHIGVKSNHLPQLPQGDYYWHEIIEMSVLNKDGKLLGTVSEILPTGANDVLVINGEKRHLIPYVMGIHIVSVDALQRQIIVDWDENF